MSEASRPPGRKPSPRGKRPPRGREFGTRFFFAAFLPKNLQKKLESAQTHLKGQWKTVPPEQLHITLLFLGDVPEARLTNLDQSAARVARSISSFTAQLRGTGFFPNEGSPRVWFAKALGEGFFELARLLHESSLLEAATEDEEELDFKPHITLARKKGPAARPAPIIFNDEWNVENFSLVKSNLSRAGPSYTVLKRYSLANPPNPDPQADSDRSHAETPSLGTAHSDQTISGTNISGTNISGTNISGTNISGTTEAI